MLNFLRAVGSSPGLRKQNGNAARQDNVMRSKRDPFHERCLCQ